MSKLVYESLIEFLNESDEFEKNLKYDNGDTLRSYISSHSSNLGKKYIMYNLFNDKGEIAYSETNKNSNEWTMTVNMPNVDKNIIKQAFERINTLVPKEAIITEDKTISIDGLRTWSQQIKHGYIEEGTNVTIGLSGIGLDNFFKEFDTFKSENKWAAIKFKDTDNANKAKEKLQIALKNNGLNYLVTISKENTLLITIPKLKKI